MMKASFTINLFLMASILNVCSSFLIPIKIEENLSSSNTQQSPQESHVIGHQQNFQTQQKVKYSSLINTDLQNDTSASRTFGLRRRLKLLIPAVMYKLGVVTTLLGVLTILAAKSLLVGLLILIIQLSTGYAKFAALKKEHHETWDPEHEHPHRKPPQNIHVHVHGGGGGGGHYKTASYSHSPYSEWDKSDLLHTNSRIDEDYYQRLKELKELKELRDSLYSQVIR